MTEESELIFEHKISYKIKSLIYKSVVIALVGENGGAIGAWLGINKVQVET